MTRTHFDQMMCQMSRGLARGDFYDDEQRLSMDERNLYIEQTEEKCRTTRDMREGRDEM